MKSSNTKMIISALLITMLLLSTLIACTSRNNESESKDIVAAKESKDAVASLEILERMPLEGNEQQWIMQNINDFSARSTPLIFAYEKDRNMLYSPASLYLALSMLYEFSEQESETRKEIQALLQPVEQGEQAKLCDALYRNMVFRSQTGKLKTGNSIWAVAEVEPQLPKDAIQTIQESYHGSVFTVDMKDAAKMEKWIGEATDGEIAHVPGGLSPDAGLVILNSILFQEEWYDAFSDNYTKEDIFYLADHSEITCNFMQKHNSNKEFIQTDTFSATRLYFRSGFQIHFILPTEGLLPSDLLKDADIFGKAMDYASDNDSRKIGDVNYRIPKVKFTTNMELIDTMRQLGMEKAFVASGDFPAMLAVSAINQDTKFEMDEKGAKATSVTKIEMSSGVEPRPEEEPPVLDLVLDRPFLFAITSNEGYILFTGIVNNPIIES